MTASSKTVAMDEPNPVDVLMVKWYLEIASTWRKAAAIVAKAARTLYPEARVYVFGGAAEDRLTATSDVDILVVLPEDPSPAERLKAKIDIMLRAFDLGLPLHYPIDLHVVGPKGFKEYLKHVRKLVPL